MTGVITCAGLLAVLMVGTRPGRAVTAGLVRLGRRPHGGRYLLLAGAGVLVFVLPGVVRRAVGSLHVERGPFHLGLAVAAMVGALIVALVLAAVALVVGAHTQLGKGFASWWQISQAMGLAAVRRSARFTRPSLRRLRGLSASECGICLGRVRRPMTRQRIFASYEDVTLVVGPPRMFKTALLGNAVIEPPGAVVVTSTKVDIHRKTATARARRGPVWVLNPEGMAGERSTFKWSPIAGCDHPATAIERAAYLVAGSPGNRDRDVTDSSFWDNSSVKVLRCYLYAAAIRGLTMADVRDWVNNPDEHEPLRILERHKGSPAGWAGALRQILTTPADRTRESVFLALQLAFEFMADPAVAAAVLPEPGDTVFDLAEFLAGMGTLYLLGAEKMYGGMGPLFSALTGYVFEESKRISQSEQCADGRLDPPLTFVLDEVASICPVPLAQWTSDAGGRGIPLLAAIQSPSQLRERWTDAQADTIWNNANITLVFGGLKKAEDLQALSQLCGDRDERVYTHSGGWWSDQPRSTSYTLRRMPVLAANEIRELGKQELLVLHRNTPPFLAKIRPVWQRQDVKAAARRPVPVPAPKPVAVEDVPTPSNVRRLRLVDPEEGTA